MLSFDLKIKIDINAPTQKLTNSTSKTYKTIGIKNNDMSKINLLNSFLK